MKERDSRPVAREKKEGIPLHLVQVIKEIWVSVLENDVKRVKNKLTAQGGKLNYGFEDMAEWLLQPQTQVSLGHTVDIDVANKVGFTPLHIACKYNKANMIQLLLQYDADITALDCQGRAPYDIAAFSTIDECVLAPLRQTKAELEEQERKLVEESEAAQERYCQAMLARDRLEMELAETESHWNEESIRREQAHLVEKKMKERLERAELSMQIRNDYFMDQQSLLHQEEDVFTTFQKDVLQVTMDDLRICEKQYKKEMDVVLALETERDIMKQLLLEQCTLIETARACIGDVQVQLWTMGFVCTLVAEKRTYIAKYTENSDKDPFLDEIEHALLHPSTVEWLEAAFSRHKARYDAILKVMETLCSLCKLCKVTLLSPSKSKVEIANQFIRACFAESLPFHIRDVIISTKGENEQMNCNGLEVMYKVSKLAMLPCTAELYEHLKAILLPFFTSKETRSVIFDLLHQRWDSVQRDTFIEQESKWSSRKSRNLFYLCYLLATQSARDRFLMQIQDGPSPIEIMVSAVLCHHESASLESSSNERRRKFYNQGIEWTLAALCALYRVYDNCPLQHLEPEIWQGFNVDQFVQGCTNRHKMKHSASDAVYYKYVTSKGALWGLLLLKSLSLHHGPIARRIRTDLCRELPFNFYTSTIQENMKGMETSKDHIHPKLPHLLNCSIVAMDIFRLVWIEHADTEGQRMEIPTKALTIFRGIFEKILDRASERVLVESNSELKFHIAALKVVDGLLLNDNNATRLNIQGSTIRPMLIHFVSIEYDREGKHVKEFLRITLQILLRLLSKVPNQETEKAEMNNLLPLVEQIDASLAKVACTPRDHRKSGQPYASVRSLVRACLRLLHDDKTHSYANIK